MLSKALPTAKAAKKAKKEAAAVVAGGDDAMEVDGGNGSGAGGDKDVEEGGKASLAAALAANPWAVLEARAVPLLHYLGSYLGKDVALFTMICRTLGYHGAAAKKSDDATRKDNALAVIEKVVQDALMPGLTLIPSNPSASGELWTVLQLLPYSTRFQIYGSIQLATQDGSEGLSPELLLSKAKTKDQTKKVLQRISNDTFKQQGRTLGKLSHSNPLVVFERVIANVKIMPNIISALVDSLRYISQLAFDALTYLLIEGLSDPNKSRLKSDGQNLADWLTALAEMVGSVSRRYPHIELGAMMKYVCMQLLSDNSHDLIVLRKIIAQMSGVEAIEDVTETQLLGQTGGPALRGETNIGSLLNAKATQRTARRLKDAALESNMAVPLLILIGQNTGSAVFNREFRQLKLIGEVYDKCHETLRQFVHFLTATMGEDEPKRNGAAVSYAKMLPQWGELVGKHKIEPEVAFHISRSVLDKHYGGAEGIVTAVKEKLPPSTWELISPQLYATFWSLSLYELDLPRSTYDATMAKIQTDVQKLERDRTMSVSQLAKKKKEKQGVLEKVRAEKTAQKAVMDTTTARLKREAPAWIVRNSGSGSAAGVEQGEGLIRFVQCCIFPRVLFSQLDAVYCARFVHKMHEVKTPYFSVLLYYDKVIKLLAPAFHCCSHNEASRLGRFLAVRSLP